jgi:hypothetical protein
MHFIKNKMIMLKNIMNDAVNYLTVVKGRFNDGELAIELINKICKLFSENKIDD